MQALILNESGTLECREVPTPSIQHPDEVLLRIEATGICGTDLHILSGAYHATRGIILGHESTGVVEEVGPLVHNVRVGERVVLDPTYHCGVCHYCQTSRPNYCTEKSHTETGVSHDGTYAAFHVAKAHFLHPLPDTVSFAVGTLTEPLACVLNALRQTRLRAESRVLIVGAGPIGMLCGLAALHMGCDVTLGDVNAYRIGRARSLFEQVQDYREAPLSEVNAALRYDIAVDTSGQALPQLLPIIARGGDILLLGLDEKAEVNIHPSYLTDNGIRLIGSIDSNQTMVPALELIRRHRDFQQIVSHEYSLSEFTRAFSTLGLDLAKRTRGPLSGSKIVLHPGSAGAPT